MKKIFKFIATLALVLPIVACEQENPDNEKPGKPDTETPGTGQEGESSKIEVIGLKAPEYAPVGGTVTVEGLGFPEGSELVLKSSDGKETVLETSALESGLSAKVPADAAQAEYLLSVKAEKYEPLVLAEKFNLYIKKSVASIENVMDMSGLIIGKVRWSAEYAGEKLTSVIKTITMPVFDDEGMPMIDETGQQSFEEMPFVYTVAEDKSVYTFTNDAGMPGFTLTVTDGKVVENTVERESGDSDKYSWLYNENGYITELKAGRTYYSYTFDDKNNLVKTTNYEFTYPETGATGEFNPYHLDAAMCMTIDQNDTLEDFQVVAVLLGLTGTPSANIPATATPDELPVVPEIDKDGYVTSLTADGELIIGMNIKWTITYR